MGPTAKKVVKITMPTCPVQTRIDAKYRRGFTLVEAMIALVIASLMVGITMLNLRGAFIKSTFKGQVHDFVSTMQKAVRSAAETGQDPGVWTAAGQYVCQSQKGHGQRFGEPDKPPVPASRSQNVAAGGSREQGGRRQRHQGSAVGHHNVENPTSSAQPSQAQAFRERIDRTKG